MKLKTKKLKKVKAKEASSSAYDKVLQKHGLSESGDSSEEESGPSDSSWMIKGESAQKRAEERARVLSRRIPTMWVPANESRKIRFRYSEPIGIYFYSIRTGPNKWESYTAPAEGEVDLFSQELGLKQRFKAVYEVFDVDGYVNKQTNKRVRYQPRFYEASGKVNDQLNLMKAEWGGKLTGRDIKIARSGAGKQTTYALIASDKSPLPESAKAQPSLLKDFAKYYAPLSEAEQRVVVRNLMRKGEYNGNEEE